MTILELIACLVLIALVFTLPTMAMKLAPNRTGPVPDTDHLTVEQQRGIRRRFLGQAQFWIIAVGLVALATLVTFAIYVIPVSPGPVVLATMLGVPYVVAIAAIMYLVHPVWHRTVTSELRRLGELRSCPRCSYDLSGLNGRACPECGTALE